MTILRESPRYSAILEEGLQEEKGLSIIRLLNKRFGTVDQGIQSQIRQLMIPQLDALGENLLDFSTVADAVAWLVVNSN